jgi:hypothetical protein
METVAGKAGMTADDWITRITEAYSDHVAAGYVRSLTPAMLAEVADLLHVDDSLPPVAMRRAIVAEARA